MSNCFAILISHPYPKSDESEIVHRRGRGITDSTQPAVRSNPRMTSMKTLLSLLIALIVAACATPPKVPNTLGDPKNATPYGYHPLDPLPIQKNSDFKDFFKDKKNVLELLSDETIRIAVGTVSAEGGISFGPAKIGIEGKNYVVILDYIKYITNSMAAGLSVDETNGKRTATRIIKEDADVGKDKAVVPAYIGVGLRLIASIYIKKGTVDLGSLIALGVAAKSEQVGGSLVIQTLGISGSEISALIPMPGDISEATIQNAIVALASIKAKIHDANTHISPRVIGVYNTLGGDETTINGFISSLLKAPIIFPAKLELEAGLH